MNLKEIFAILLGVIGGAVGVSAANLLTNPGFETENLTGWTTWGSAITQTPEQKHGGSYSCLNTARTADWQGCVQDLTGKLTVGVTYRVEAWMRLRNAASASAQILIKTTYGGADHYAASPATLVFNSAWTRLVFSYTHAGSGTIITYFYAVAGQSTVEFFVDDVALEVTYDPQAAVVDLSTNLGPATPRASGFLFGVSDTEPSAARFESLQPGLVRFDAALGNPNFRGTGTGFASPGFMNRIKATGAKMQIVVSDEYQWVNNYHNAWGWPGDPPHDGYDSYQLLDLVINNLLDAAAANFPAAGGWAIEWDVWNEPDWITFWGRSQTQFFNTWQHAVELIRSRDPNAVIVGPSAASYNPGNNGKYLKDFLVFARDRNVLPNVLSWHNLGTVTNLTASVRTMRDFMASNSIPALPIDLNEYVGDQEFTNAARHLSYLVALERAGVRRAAHAVWDEVPNDYWSNGLQPGNLCHLLTRDATHDPRAVWHLYKSYADLAGNLLNLSPSKWINGLGAIDTNGTVRMILGNDSNSTNTANLTVSRLDVLPYYPQGAMAIMVKRLPNTGSKMLPSPILASHSMVKTSANTLPLPFTFAPGEILLVTLLKPPGLEALPVSHASPEIIVHGVPGFHYRVEFCNALASNPGWDQLVDIPSLPQPDYTVPTSASSGLTNCFYRVALIP